MNDLEQRDALPFSLRALTPARVALARAGSSLATEEILNFSLAHAQARDAVYALLDIELLVEGLRQRGRKALAVRSAAEDRPTYIRRPDRGRMLSDSSRTALREAADRKANPEVNQEVAAPRLTVILADGLSALATNRHALPLLDQLLPCFGTAFALTSILVAEQARVALGDEAGLLLGADLTLMLLGERPGLSSPDSLGAYLTWHPRPGRTDAERNCVSNIRPEGLDYATASQRIASLCVEAARRRLTGIALKEPDSHPVLPEPAIPVAPSAL